MLFYFFYQKASIHTTFENVRICVYLCVCVCVFLEWTIVLSHFPNYRYPIKAGRGGGGGGQVDGSRILLAAKRWANVLSPAS